VKKANRVNSNWVIHSTPLDDWSRCINPNPHGDDNIALDSPLNSVSNSHRRVRRIVCITFPSFHDWYPGWGWYPGWLHPPSFDIPIVFVIHHCAFVVVRFPGFENCQWNTD
jgi:hypothetical protein